MKNNFLLATIILMMQGCVLDNESRMRTRLGGYVGDKFDAYEFIDMSPKDCLTHHSQAFYHKKRILYPWNPLNNENCGIHKISETSKTADYEITYYGTCKYIYTVEKKTDLILAWRYTKDSKNCVPGP